MKGEKLNKKEKEREGDGRPEGKREEKRGRKEREREEEEENGALAPLFMIFTNQWKNFLILLLYT
jgi:hypothetical protein